MIKFVCDNGSFEIQSSREARNYNNGKAIGFYHSMGYETMYEFVTFPNRKMYRLIKTLK